VPGGHCGKPRIRKFRNRRAWYSLIIPQPTMPIPYFLISSLLVELSQPNFAKFLFLREEFARP